MITAKEAKHLMEDFPVYKTRKTINELINGAARMGNFSTTVTNLPNNMHLIEHVADMFRSEGYDVDFTVNYTDPPTSSMIIKWAKPGGPSDSKAHECYNNTSIIVHKIFEILNNDIDHKIRADAENGCGFTVFTFPKNCAAYDAYELLIRHLKNIGYDIKECNKIGEKPSAIQIIWDK